MPPGVGQPAPAAHTLCASNPETSKRRLVPTCVARPLACALQRIAKRSKVLSEPRIALLDDIGFDWTGADPLS
jgi:hypothetical protein